MFSLAEKAHKVFSNGDLKTKRDILSSIGTQFLLKERKLHSFLEKIEEIAPEVQDLHKQLEPLKSLKNQEYSKKSHIKPFFNKNRLESVKVYSTQDFWAEQYEGNEKWGRWRDTIGTSLLSFFS